MIPFQLNFGVVGERDGEGKKGRKGEKGGRSWFCSLSVSRDSSDIYTMSAVLFTRFFTPVPLLGYLRRSRSFFLMFAVFFATGIWSTTRVRFNAIRVQAG